MHPATFPPQNLDVLDIVGSNTFGINPKISPSQTYNMYITDDALVSTPGYKRRINYGGQSQGRGNYTTFRGDFMLHVRGNEVYRVSGPRNNVTSQFIFSIETFFGKVSMDENIAFQIALCDGKSLWIYDYRAGTVQKAVLPINTQTGVEIIPGFVTFQAGYFIVSDTSGPMWYLSPLNDGAGNWNWGAGGVPVSTNVSQEADKAQAVIIIPGKSNMVLALGAVNGGLWYNTGDQLFPYKLTSSLSVDYGLLSISSLAASEEFVVYLGVNEKSGPCIVVCDGGSLQRLSTDGIDYRLESLKNPSASNAMFYRKGGHLFYILTFHDPEDNFTLMYDFNTKRFFYLTDENDNYFISADICRFNNTYYFGSLNDGDLYELNFEFTQYDYGDLGIYLIPSKRYVSRTAPIDSSQRVGNSLSFPVRQGEDAFYKSAKTRYLTTESGQVLTTERPEGYVGRFFSTELVLEDYSPRIDMAISRDGGATFGNFTQKFLNPLGVRKNRVVFWNFGMNNEFCAQFRFWSKSGITVMNGVISNRERE